MHESLYHARLKRVNANRDEGFLLNEKGAAGAPRR
jgi:hypothetical protein